MRELRQQAYAKINLTLDVLGKRQDGYHELSMVMQSVSLADTVILREFGEQDFSLTSNLGFLPGTDKNIAAVAARVFAAHTGISLAGLQIHLDKRIPVCAGTAGGSSDGAAVLRGLNEWFSTGLSRPELARLGEKVGSDVPYCVLGCTALAEGRGERLTALPSLPRCHIVLCKPGFSISTPELFHRIDQVKLHFHPDTPGVIQALEQGDDEAFYMGIHNMKGLAGNLSIEPIFDCTQAMLVEFQASGFLHRQKLRALLRETEEASRALAKLVEQYLAEGGDRP